MNSPLETAFSEPKKSRKPKIEGRTFYILSICKNESIHTVRFTCSEEEADLRERPKVIGWLRNRKLQNTRLLKVGSQSDSVCLIP
jgi:hypothetical protein